MKEFDIFDIFGFGTGSGTGSDICIITMGTSGDWRGHIAGSGSVISPSATYAGLDIYEYKWNIVTGQFIISFGVAGDDELANIVQIIVKHPRRPDSNSAVWNSTDTQYDFVDLDLAQWIDDDIARSCFIINFQPIILIQYDFSNILVGTGS